MEFARHRAWRASRFSQSWHFLGKHAAEARQVRFNRRRQCGRVPAPTNVYLSRINVTAAAKKLRSTSSQSRHLRTCGALGVKDTAEQLASATLRQESRYVLTRSARCRKLPRRKLNEFTVADATHSEETSADVVPPVGRPGGVLPRLSAL